VALLPAKGDVAGWATSRAPRGFNPDNLFELIDGAADSFIEYGVQQMVTADYTQSGTGFQAVIELYQMKDPLNAFGKYAEERNPESDFLTVGNEGYSGGTAVNFWTGPYYVKVTAFQDKDAIKQELVKLAQAVAAKVKDPASPPAEIAAFPKEGQLPHTARYIPKDVLAQSYFTNGYEASYKTAAKPSKLVLIELDAPAAAKDAIAKYQQAVAKDGKDVKAIQAPAEGGFAGKDGFYGTLVAARAGRHIAVAAGVTSEEAGKKQVAELLAAVK